VTILTEDHGLPVRRACQIARCSRTAFYHSRRGEANVSPADVDTPVITALQAVIEKHGRWGLWKCFDRLRVLGHALNHKRFYRVYCALG
jgi:putative transposase